MTVSNWYEFFCARISPVLSEVWDNDGLMCCPDPDREVGQILFALDVTDAVVERAVEIGAELIVSHHPLIFSPLASLTPDDPVARRVMRLLSAGISVFSFHTRFDRASGGVNDTLAKQLRLSNVCALGEGDASLGRVGELRAPMALSDFAEYVKLALGAPAVQVWDASCPVHRVAVVGGEGKDFIAAAVSSGADTYLSGRLGYHHMQDRPINLIEAGHYFTERQATVALAALAEEAGADVKTEIYAPNPLAVY